MESINLLNQSRERLIQLVEKEKNKEKTIQLKQIVNNLPDRYLRNTSIENIYTDICYIYEYQEERISGNFICCQRGDKFELTMKFFLKGDYEYKLSDIIRILDNLMVTVNDYTSYKILNNEEKITIFEFQIDNIAGEECNSDKLSAVNFFKTFEKLLTKKWIESIFNKLSILCGLSFREIQLLTVIDRFFKQIAQKYDYDVMNNLSISQSLIFVKFVELFQLRLSPELKNSGRLDKINKKKQEINELLNSVNNINEFKTLKDFYEVTLAISRTNFYQNKDYISIKIKSQLISFLSDVQPFAEVFVFSSDFEALHLRGSKVSRGGIRWSDRRDYRTEVLGLMRAQMKKNTIIVPSGAKGGFYIFDSEKNKDRKFAIKCYKTFLCGILDLTDNLDEKNHTIRPEKVIIAFDLHKSLAKEEESDPYIVAAADKGTGSFSDYANQVSHDYGFWLGDAFASGGSHGYDHKKLAITSRGAWISVEQLFCEIGKNIKDSEFTVIGIGDMIGDVFGNGMLLSNKIRLVGAFNHAHIFLDPNPNSETSFIERKRMFDLPTSTWESYNKELISEGGGIFSRNEKSITLTKEIARVLDIPTSIISLSPDELIKYILKAKVDLLWNGGIGTFVKAECQSNDDVSDKANDNIRINGNNLRCKVVGEGGNLGFTQFGRIEYARNGGKINTDFIDNSAGVSCSDREVNLKILFNKLDFEKRNKLLSEMKEDICHLVLKDNLLQNNALMIEESYKFLALDRHTNLIDKLEKMKILNRKSENIPSDQQLEKMQSAKQFLTRPELAILLTYSKVWLKKEILNSSIPDNKYFEKFLIGYFPKIIQEDFKEEIINHPLRREIITNYITNTLINRMGICFILNIINKTGKKIDDIIYAYFMIRDSYRMRDIWHDIEYSHKFSEIDSKIKSLLEIRKFAEYAVCWFLQQSHGDYSDLQGNILELRENIEYILHNFESLSSKKNICEYKIKVSQLIKQGLKEEFATKLAKINFLLFAPSLFAIHKKIGIDLKVIVKLYFLIEDKLDLRNIRRNIMNWRCYDMTQESSVGILIDNIANEHFRILEYVIRHYYLNGINGDEHSVISLWIKKYESHFESYSEIVSKVQYNSEIDYSHVILLVSRMGLLYKK